MSFKRNLLVMGVVTSLALLSGCNTVRGTMVGAGQDVQSVSNAVASQPAPVRKKVRRHRAHKVSTTTTTSSNTDNTGKTSTTNETNSNTSTTY